MGHFQPQNSNTYNYYSNFSTLFWKCSEYQQKLSEEEVPSSTHYSDLEK